MATAASTVDVKTGDDDAFIDAPLYNLVPKVYRDLQQDAINMITASGAADIDLSLRQPTTTPYDIVIAHSPPPYSSAVLKLLDRYSTDPRFRFKENATEKTASNLAENAAAASAAAAAAAPTGATVKDVNVANVASVFPWDTRPIVTWSEKMMYVDDRDPSLTDEPEMKHIAYLVAQISPIPVLANHGTYRFLAKRDNVRYGSRSENNDSLSIRIAENHDLGMCSCHPRALGDRVDFFIEYDLPRFAKRRIYLGQKTIPVSSASCA